MSSRPLLRWCLGLVLLGSTIAGSSSAAEFTSHAPVRPLPQASSRPLAAGPAKFVDAKNGDDANDGSEQKPWRTLGLAVTKLQPGDTLYLRGGVYYEHVRTTLIGTAEQPITIRAYPGELVTLDGGLPEFQLDHAASWESDPDGVAGEYRSTKTYPDQGSTAGDLKIGAVGLFVDSLLPLHGYWHHPDLQSDNPYWTLGGGEKTKPDAHVYCGPGLWYNPETSRIHCRLAHTKLPGLGDNNYTGETDPRKIPLVVATYGAGPVLQLQHSRYVRLQDLVIRGARSETLSLDGGANLELDGLTIYGGGACLGAPGIHGLRVANTACRGLAGPWTFRGSLKYRSLESRIIRTGGWDPSGDDGRDYEFANCEFTDSVDGVFIGNIHRVAFHHNLVENISDDAVFVTSNTAYDGTTPGGGSWFYQNRFARNLTCFAFGVGHGRQKAIGDGQSNATTKRQLGEGMWIARNVFDFRRSVMYHWPTGPDDVQEIVSLGRFAGDHGSPARERMEIVHNTVLAGDTPRYEYGTDGFSGAMQQGTRRRVYNNIIYQLKGLPGDYLPPGDTDYAVDGNMLWSVDTTVGTVDWKPRYLKDKTPPKAEWAAHDKYADPQFVAYDADWRKPVDLRLRDGSPAIDGGVSALDVEPGRGLLYAVPEDKGAPDVGALARGSEIPRIGCFGRFDLCGNPVPADPKPQSITWQFAPVPTAELPPLVDKPAVVVTGYPAFDAPLVLYALRKAGVPVVELERQWLDPKDYAKYGTIIVDGSFTRGKIVPDKFSSADLVHVKKFLEAGGTLWLCRDRQDLFLDREPKIFLYELTGGFTSDRSLDHTVLKPDHPWVRGLPPTSELAWLLSKNAKPLSIKKGEVLIGTSSGNALLGRIPVGAGQIIYLGFSPAASLPNGREKVTVAQEREFTEQMQVLTNIVDGLYPKK